MTSWLFKYAFAMLEQLADGEFHAPVVSVDMLSPFEQRPLVLLLICVAMGQFAFWMDSAAGYAITALLVALLPALIGVLGTTGRAILSLHPLVLLQTVRGMGWWYLLVMILVAALIGLSVWLLQSSVWRVAVIWQIGLSVLMIFSLIGGVMYERRIEIGHEPRNSPERHAVLDQREHQRKLKRVLDEIYNAVRLGDLIRGVTELEQWFARVDEEFVASDCEAVHSTICTWGDTEMLTVASRMLATILANKSHTEMLSEIIQVTLKNQPAFTLKSESSLMPVVHGLQAGNRSDLAFSLVKNFVNAFPAQMTSGISALLQRLNHVKQ